MRNIKEIIVHCSASDFGNAKRLTEWHLERGFSTIGYHYVINNGYVNKGDEYQENVMDGFIEKGREDNRPGAHTAGHNSDSIGICLIGNKTFSTEQFMALANLLRGLLVQYNLTKDDIKGHYMYSGKTCPNFKIDWFIENYINDDK